MSKGVKRKDKNKKTNIVRTPGRRDLSYLTGVTPKLKIGKILSIFMGALIMPMSDKRKAPINSNVSRLRELTSKEWEELDEQASWGLLDEWPYKSDQDLDLEHRRQEEI